MARCSPRRTALATPTRRWTSTSGSRRRRGSCPTRLKIACSHSSRSVRALGHAAPQGRIRGRRARVGESPNPGPGAAAVGRGWWRRRAQDRRCCLPVIAAAARREQSHRVGVGSRAAMAAFSVETAYDDGTLLDEQFRIWFGLFTHRAGASEAAWSTRQSAAFRSSFSCRTPRVRCRRGARGWRRRRGVRFYAAEVLADAPATLASAESRLRSLRVEG